jgi:hypothetical protein
MHDGFDGVEGLIGTGMLVVDLKCKVVATRDEWLHKSGLKPSKTVYDCLNITVKPAAGNQA